MHDPIIQTKNLTVQTMIKLTAVLDEEFKRLMKLQEYHAAKDDLTEEASKNLETEVASTWKQMRRQRKHLEQRGVL